MWLLAAVASLLLSPKGFAMSPAVLTVRVALEKTEEHYCPEITIEWAEGNSSFQQSDCAPWEEEENKDEQWIYRKQSPGAYPPGDHEIRVTLRQGKWSVRLVDTFRVR